MMSMFDPGGVRKGGGAGQCHGRARPVRVRPGRVRHVRGRATPPLDAVEAEYGRLAAGVDASWMAQATGSSLQLAKQHAAVGAALQASPLLAEAVRAGEVALENVAV